MSWSSSRIRRGRLGRGSVRIRGRSRGSGNRRRMRSLATARSRKDLWRRCFRCFSGWVTMLEICQGQLLSTIWVGGITRVFWTSGVALANLFSTQPCRLAFPPTDWRLFLLESQSQWTSSMASKNNTRPLWSNQSNQVSHNHIPVKIHWHRRRLLLNYRKWKDMCNN